MVQKLKKWICTARDRPGTKTEIIIVTINVKVNSEDDTFSEIGVVVYLQQNKKKAKAEGKKCHAKTM